ncbi:TonB-dependent receptor [Riemerella anatipestifer]|uniref:TonB-dependent receptor plug domain-containing protein n=1 Tax=Riemerella anatipestifer TaxID=34085 RepID=UPI00129DC369|nr:outer membrane beta-barrel protein [Riemerella anatipestifer]MRN17050.1 TonB-dependent receptor [Riemerella anatipestifer]
MKRGVILILLHLPVLSFTQELKTDSVTKAKEIQEVIIKSQRKKQYNDHAAYTFDKAALEKANNAKDLLVTLPELVHDPINNSTKSIRGGKTLFLINGIEATEAQIRSVAPTNVVRVEYYDIPPARWANRADVVVNMITRNPELGYSYGADITSALTTGFLNGMVYANYTKGKNDFGLEYSLNIREYNDRRTKKILTYNINGIHYSSEILGRDAFGYTNQDIALRYTRVEPERYTFQAKFSIFPFTYHNEGESSNLFTQTNIMNRHQVKDNSSEQYTSPTIDLYYSKNLGKKDELIFNFVGSYYKTNSNQYRREWNTSSNTEVFLNDMKLNSIQTGVVGEVAHSHRFEKGKLTSGYRLTNTNVDNQLNNILGASQFEVNYLEQYFYTEYNGKWDKLGYRLGIGANNIQNKTATSFTNDWALTPKLVLSYALGDKQSFRFFSSYKNINPSGEMMSPNLEQTMPNLFRSGNPDLKPQRQFRNQLNYSFNSKYFDLNTIGFYNNVRNYFAQFYQENSRLGGYVLNYQNIPFYRETGVAIIGSVKPFANDLLVLRLYLQPTSMLMETQEGNRTKVSYVRNNFTLISRYKQWSLTYQFNIPVYSVGGSFLNTEENKNDLFLAYQLGNWKLSTGMYFMGVPAQYKMKTLDFSPVQNESNTQIFDCKNMFVLGVSYDFSLGKKLQVQKKLDNQTSGAVTF